MVGRAVGPLSPCLFQHEHTTAIEFFILFIVCCYQNLLITMEDIGHNRSNDVTAAAGDQQQQQLNKN
jgi:hypothetical protein